MMKKSVLYRELNRAYTKNKSSTMRIVGGDLIARVQIRLDGEEDVVGTHIFSKSKVDIEERTHTVWDNRHRLIEFCMEHEMFLMST